MAERNLLVINIYKSQESAAAANQRPTQMPRCIAI
jgi:hypothetical protein